MKVPFFYVQALNAREEIGLHQQKVWTRERNQKAKPHWSDLAGSQSRQAKPDQQAEASLACI